MPLAAAQAANAWFLAVVAGWRVALLGVFLRRVAGLTRVEVVVAALLPLVVIVVALTVLNLAHVVFELMSGIRPEQGSGNDLSYTVVIVIAVFSIYALPFLLITYGWLVYRARRAGQPAR
jgi:hypothetical protein